MENILEQLPDVDCLKQDFHPNLTNWLPFYWNDYQESTRYTYQLHNLQDLDKTYAAFNRNIKRNIKKAKAAVRIVQDLSPTAFYEISEKSFARQGLKMPYSFSQFLKQDQALAKHQARQMFFAMDEQDNIHAAAYLIWDGQSSYYHLSGDNSDFRKSGATILLIWEAIQYTQQVLGLNTFDFEGSMVKRIELVRRQFGAVQQPYFRIWKYNSLLYKVLDKMILKN
jgi:lipid II:glycine glycyltransferase (peptidoglycan interpeptide bridge formation enzyme)